MPLDACLKQIENANATLFSLGLKAEGTLNPTRNLATKAKDPMKYLKGSFKELHYKGTIRSSGTFNRKYKGSFQGVIDTESSRIVKSTRMKSLQTLAP